MMEGLAQDDSEMCHIVIASAAMRIWHTKYRTAFIAQWAFVAALYKRNDIIKCTSTHCSLDDLLLFIDFYALYDTRIIFTDM